MDGTLSTAVFHGKSLRVHYTVTGIVSLDQECLFGDGGVASGAATCTADGRLDRGNSNGPRTHTFVKNDVDRYWIRNTVAVTSGENGLAPAITATINGNAATTVSGGGHAQVVGQGTQTTGISEQVVIPMGVTAMALGVGGILMAALAL